MSRYRPRQAAPALGSGSPAEEGLSRTITYFDGFFRAQPKRRSSCGGRPHEARSRVAQDERINILGVGVNVDRSGRAVATVERWISERSQNYVCVTGAFTA